MKTKFCNSFEDRIKAGKAASQAREYGITLIKPGAKYIDVIEAVEKKIIDLGAGIGFPADLSANNVAAHDTPFPNDERVLEKGDLVKLDLGTHINGEVADTAMTVEVGNTGKYNELIKASAEGLRAAIETVKPGVKIHKIGKAIQDTITSHGFVPVANLCGHGVGIYDVHISPSIPNYDNGDENTLEEGQVIAIEPFATDGIGLVKQGKMSSIYALLHKKPVRMQSVKQILDHIEKNYKTLPFAARWLKMQGAQFALRILEKEGILHQYEQLPEKSDALVSQKEHTLIVGHGVIT